MTNVADVMSTSIVSVGPSANLLDAVGAMSHAGSGSVLVLDGEALLGIFTERDVMRALRTSESADRARVSSVAGWMSQDPVTVGPDTSVGEALNQMLFGGFRHLPVIEADRVVGVVSMRDLARSIAPA